MNRLLSGRVLSASDVYALRLWESEPGTLVATFACEAAARSCAFGGDRGIVARDSLGWVHFLELIEKS